MAASRGGGPGDTPGGPELIVRLRQPVRLAGDGALRGSDEPELAKALTELASTVFPLSARAPSAVAPARAATADAGAELARHYRVALPADADEDRIARTLDRLAGERSVLTAYAKPAAVLPVLPPAAVGWKQLDDPEPEEAISDFLTRQGYLQPGPVGIDALPAWRTPGGDGAGVRLVDVEKEWRFTHEDLREHRSGLLGGLPPGDVEWRNHGTNVIGILAGDHNGRGISGICPAAWTHGFSVERVRGGVGGALTQAAAFLRAGDILLVELMRDGPNRPPDAAADDQRGCIPVEWWPDEFLAIREATDRGVIVVAAAGNGSEDLDAAIYRSAREQAILGRVAGPNPFERTPESDSGSLLVGAGAPPPRLARRDYGPDRSRLAFSNWGACIDAQGWGRAVATTGGLGVGSDEMRPGPFEDRWYTNRFSGTSSAAPIVAGALACVQGMLRASGRRPLTPAEARQALRETGAAQQDAPALGEAPARPAAQRIGNRPDTTQLLAWARERIPPGPRLRPRPRPRRSPMRVQITITDDGVVSDGIAQAPQDEYAGGAAAGYKPTYVRGPSVRVELEEGGFVDLPLHPDFVKQAQLSAPAADAPGDRVDAAFAERLQPIAAPFIGE
jgi:hypothetical protein